MNNRRTEIRRYLQTIRLIYRLDTDVQRLCERINNRQLYSHARKTTENSCYT